MNACFIPGGIMYDTDGDVIHAHGGGLWYENETWYWFGENKKYTTKKSKIWTWGIHCYTSKDLYNWKNEGLIIPPNTKDENSSLHPNRCVDRPHILKRKSDGKYICWLKISGADAYFVVLTADQILGPYTIVRDRTHPFGTDVGDFDIWQDENGNGYIWFEHDHSGMIAAHLSPDLLDVVEPFRDLFAGLKPPHTREGITHFAYKDKHYLLTSGMSGYVPNPSQVAVSDDPLGPFSYVCDPHRNDPSGASFNSQVSAIIQYPVYPELYLVLADRWIPSLLLTRSDMERINRGQKALESKQYLQNIYVQIYIFFHSLLLLQNVLC